MTQLDLTLANATHHYSVTADLAGVTALFGPSGVGKTTLLRAIAGFTPDMKGRVTLGATTLQDSATGTFISAHKRQIATVFQDSRLFPHLSVNKNLTYGAKRATNPDGPAFDAVVDALDLRPLMAQMPETLSGGEKQRVAIGRALLSRPNLILMDEPLAALDADRKDDILPYVAALPSQFDLPVIYVTHAMAEVQKIASRVLWMTSGNVAPALSVTDFVTAQAGSRPPADAVIDRIENNRTYVTISGQTIAIEGVLGAAGDRLRLVPDR